MIDADKSIDEKLLALIAEAVPGKFKKKALTMESMLRKDLGIDSLALLSVMFRLEQTFGIDISKLNFAPNMAETRTVNDAISMAKVLLQKAEAEKNA
jgi:acyl carrier protein